MSWSVRCRSCGKRASAAAKVSVQHGRRISGGLLSSPSKARYGPWKEVHHEATIYRSRIDCAGRSLRLNRLRADSARRDRWNRRRCVGAVDRTGNDARPGHAERRSSAGTTRLHAGLEYSIGITFYAVKSLDDSKYESLTGERDAIHGTGARRTRVVRIGIECRRGRRGHGRGRRWSIATGIAVQTDRGLAYRSAKSGGAR